MSDPIRSISQNNFILATQQEISHDNTLTGNGTPESPLGVANSSDETVLFSNSSGVNGNNLPSGMTDLNTFKYVRITMSGYSNIAGGYEKHVVMFTGDSPYFSLAYANMSTNYYGYVYLKNNGTSLGFKNSYTGKPGNSSAYDDRSLIRVYEVVGIN